MSLTPTRTSPRMMCFPRVSGDDPLSVGPLGGARQFSRVSGDEPQAATDAASQNQFSPRERG